MAIVWLNQVDLTDEQMLFARRCYRNGVAHSHVARSLKIAPMAANSLFDQFRRMGIPRAGRAQQLPVTLPKLKYLEGPNA